MRILVTNDDGIDSVGLHVLARAMRPYGEVVVAAPDFAQRFVNYSPGHFLIQILYSVTSKKD
jgi:broad specificity polyphosphatase/5'/3'-nucleotidase SurE